MVLTSTEVVRVKAHPQRVSVDIGAQTISHYLDVAQFGLVAVRMLRRMDARTWILTYGNALLS